MRTIVVNLDNGDEYEYTVSPEKAVVNAFYQYAQKNFNTWEYDYSLVRYSATARIVYCGSFAARV